MKEEYDQHIRTNANTNLRSALRALKQEGKYDIDGTIKSSFLGSGATSHVYRVIELETHKCYAAKFFRNHMASTWDADMFCKAAIRLIGKNVVPDLVERIELCQRQWLVIIMPLLVPIPFNKPGAASFADGMRRCLKEFHDAGFAHGDIHQDNFMLDPETKTVRIIDFGLSYDYIKPAGWFLPKVPRGKRFRTVGEWDWLIRRIDQSSTESLRQADFLIDTVKLEATIDFLGI